MRNVFFYYLCKQNCYSMKRLLTLFAIIAMGGMFCTVSAAKKLTPAQALIQRLAKIQKKGYMYGHQDDVFYGVSWNWEFGRSDTYDLVGDYPGIMGFDMGGLEVGDSKNLDSVPFTRIREAVQQHYERGGIITLSWHPRNPYLGTTAWIGSDTTAYDNAVKALLAINRKDLVAQLDDPRLTVRNILPNGKTHKKFMLWLSRLTDFITSLKDSKGNQIPVIFRPYHENTGSWFWWGKDLCTVQEYKQLWSMTQDYINAQQNLGDYVVWSYSPSWYKEEAMDRYPGDDRVELLGTDVYQWGPQSEFVNNLDRELAFLTQMGKERNKIIAVTECGYQNSPDPTWWSKVFKPIADKYTFAYFLPWRNWHAEHFGAAPGIATADDFKQMAKEKNVLFLKDIKKIK